MGEPVELLELRRHLVGSKHSYSLYSKLHSLSLNFQLLSTSNIVKAPLQPKSKFMAFNFEQKISRRKSGLQDPKMFELSLESGQGNLLKKLAKAVKNLVKNTKFNFCASAAVLYLQGSDFYGSDSAVSLVELVIPADFFQHFECHSQTFFIEINLDSLAKLLECVDDDITTIRADDHGRSTINFMFRNPYMVVNSRMKFRRLRMEHLVHFPEREFTAIVTMSSSRFECICTGLSAIGIIGSVSAVTISVTNEEVKFSTRGFGTIGTTNIVCKAQESTIIETREPITLRFPLKYFPSFTNVTPLAN